MLIATDALVFTPLPIIVFDIDGGSMYSQGTTSFFAIGSLTFTYLAFSVRAYGLRLFLLLISLGMLSMSALSGARGDFAIGVIVILLILIKHFSIKNVLVPLVVFSSIIIMVIPNLSQLVPDLLIFRRFAVVFGGENFGLRDVLLIQSIDLLSEQTACLFIGCGFNYFQVFYGYDFGMYPHNIFAEMLITYGTFLGGILVVLVCLGVAFGYLSQYSLRFIYWIFLYYLGVALKSGPFISITSVPIVIFFVYLGLCSIRLFSARLNRLE